VISLIPFGESGSVLENHSYFPNLVSPQLIFTLKTPFFVSISVISMVIKNLDPFSGGTSLSTEGIISFAHFSNPYF
jgi:hypothetical protein